MDDINNISDETIEIFTETVDKDFDDIGWDPIAENDEDEIDNFGYYNND